MIGIKIAVSMISLKLILLDNSLGNSKFNTVSLVVRESIVNTYDRFYESKIREKMNLNDFITILKISILIDLGMYSMSLIKNRIYILCIHFLFKKVVAGYNFLGIRSETRYKVRSIFEEF